MIKAELMKLKKLPATKEILEIAAADVPAKQTIKTYWGSTQTKTIRKWCLFMRTGVEGGYLKAAFFLPEHLRSGGRKPVYELYIHKKKGQYLTYDCQNSKWLTAMVENLTWPWGYVYWREGDIWYSQRDGQRVQEYLGTQKSGWAGIMEYQRKCREEAIRLREKRETDPWDEELKQTPALPKDWDRWVSKVGIDENYILYKYQKSGAITGRCTYCEQEVTLKSPRHNDEITCPNCGRPVTCKSIGRVAKAETKTKYVYLIQRTKQGFVIRTFRAEREYRRYNGWKEELFHHEIRRSFYGKDARPVSTYSKELYKNKEVRFCRKDSWAYLWWGSERGRVYGKTIPTLGKAELFRTGLPEYLKLYPEASPEKYLTIWTESPQVELLVKADLPELLDSCLKNRAFISEVFDSKKQGSLAKRLRLDDSRLKRLRSNHGGISYYHWLRYEKRRDAQIPDDAIRFFCDNGIGPSGMTFIRDRMSEIQVCNYIRRQMEETGMTFREVMDTWKDYLSMAERFGMDTNDAIIYRAAKLKQRHDELVLRGKLENLKEKAKEILNKYPHAEDVLHDIREIYSYADEKYTVVVPDSLVDIMIEGQNLNHCVGTSDRYYDRIERRESYILFLRKTDAPEQSYYTLEVEPGGAIRQKRTMFDRQHPDIEEATKFLKRWQKEITKRLTKNEKALAQTSKVLREEGFKQMRRDNVTIRAGDLQGKKLVDVLMADLMENEEDKTA